MNLPSKWLVYLLALSVAATFAMIGWTFRENHEHQQDLADAVVERQQAVNEFLRTEVCERLQLRDEIQIAYLKAAAAKYRRSDPVYSSVLADAALALEITQQGCQGQIPKDG